MITTQVLTSVKKEVWEFKRTLLWLPAIMIGLVVLSIAWAIFNLQDHQLDRIMWEIRSAEEAARFSEIGKGAIVGMIALFIPFIFVSVFIQLHYFLSCLFDERRDLSVYFWRSLPVSDWQTILVKLFTGSFVIPGAFLAAASTLTAVVLLMLLVGCIVLSVGYDISIWSIWGHLDILSNLSVIWLTLIPLVIWLFPFYAWLLLASSFASRAPFLWATVPVVILVLVEAFIAETLGSHSLYIAETINQYFNLSYEMGSNLVIMADMPPDSYSEKLLVARVLLDKANIVAILIGCGFLYGAYWMRAKRQH